MKSAVWISRGPETTPLMRALLRAGYKRVETQRLRSEHTYPKSCDLYVKEVQR